MSSLPEYTNTKATARRDFIGEFVADIGKALEEGTAPWCKPWKAGELAPPCNPVSGTTYSGMNFVRLAQEGLADPRYMTFNHAQKEGFRIKKGEKGRPVVFWSHTDRGPKLDEKFQPVLDDKGKPVTEERMRTRPIMQYSTVFHASQIEGIDPWQKKGPEWASDERAEAILRNSGAQISHEQRDRAFYSPTKDSIHLNDKSAFPTAGDYYSTALHELAHWTGHKDRMNRDMGTRGTLGYAKEELRAEIAAWMLATKLGLPFDPEPHRSYVESWASIVKDEPKFVVQACSDAEKICTYCLKFEHEKALEHKQVDTQQVQPDERIAAKDMPQRKARPFTEKDTRLQVPYVQKDAALAHGAMWDAEERTWFAPEGTDLAPLAQWLPKEQALAPEPEQRHEHALPSLSYEVEKLVTYEEVKPAILAFDSVVNTNDFDTTSKEAFIAGWMEADGKKFSKEEILQEWLDITGGRMTRSGDVNNIHYGVIVGRAACPWESNSRLDGLISVPHDVVSPFEMGKEWFKQYSNNIKIQEYINQDTVFVAPNEIRLDVPDSHNEFIQHVHWHAHWSAKEQAWYVRAGEDLAPFAEWLPEGQKLKESLADKRVNTLLFDTAMREAFKEGVKKTGVDMTELENQPSPSPNAWTGEVWPKGSYPWLQKNTRISMPSGIPVLSAIEECGIRFGKARQRLLEYEAKHERALPTLSPEEEFAQTLKSYGLDLKGELPIMDGVFHRVSVENGKPGAQDGSYMGYRDGRPAGTLTNFKTGEQVTWKYSGGHTLSAASIAELSAKSKIQAEAREQARTALQEQTAKQCQMIWEKAAQIPEGHSYLVQKGVDSEEIRKGLKIDQKGNILVPLRDTQGTIRSLQTISVDPVTQKNTKRFTKNAKKSGMFHLVDPENVFDKKPIILAEGLATAASINKATGLPVSCVFDAGNLIHVARQFREQYPDKPIIIMADNDSQLTTGNVGLKKAHEVRNAVSDVFVCTPHFTEQEQKKGNTDFNDFQKLHGVAKLKEAISDSFCKAKEVGNALRMDIANIIIAVGKSIQPAQLNIAMKNQGMSR